MSFIFTSESVSAGHPDKIADQISDAIVDALLSRDKDAKIACETLVKTGAVIIAGEISTHAWIDLEELVREVVRDIGYTGSKWGFDADTCAVISMIGKQSPDIAKGVDKTILLEQGAGDQGLVFGYATDETTSYMPAAIDFAHKLVKQHAACRNDFAWMGPDSKSQVTVVYDDDYVPAGIDNIVFSTQHLAEIDLQELRSVVLDKIITPVIPQQWLTSEIDMYINPAGEFVIGGPVGDCGLTGRKIIVDTYGGMARHGGGCFSGKDPSKVDRSAAYMARYVAKNVVAAKLAKRCEVQITYAIGVHKPTSVRIETFGTGTIADVEIIDWILDRFDLTPYGIINTLDLKRPIFRNTAVFGHFGRSEQDFSWENILD